MNAQMSWARVSSALLALGLMPVHDAAAQRMLNPRVIEGAEHIELGCRGAIRQKLPPGTRPTPSGEAKKCAAVIVAPPGYVLKLTGRENANAPKNGNRFGKDGSSFIYGTTGCDRGYGFGANCPALMQNRYLIAVPLECSTTGGRADVSTPDIRGRVTLIYQLAPEATARASDKFLGPRPTVIDFGKLPACP